MADEVDGAERTYGRIPTPAGESAVGESTDAATARGVGRQESASDRMGDEGRRILGRITDPCRIDVDHRGDGILLVEEQLAEVQVAVDRCQRAPGERESSLQHRHDGGGLVRELAGRTCLQTLPIPGQSPSRARRGATEGARFVQRHMSQTRTDVVHGVQQPLRIPLDVRSRVPPSRAVDTLDLVRQIAKKAEGIAGAEVELGPIADVVAVVDPERITQAILQLAQNAVTHGGGRLMIGCRTADADVEFWVRDHGPGVPDATKTDVFDRFHRGADTAGRSGSGLGLNIVKVIAAAHGGTAHVADAQGGGAVFVLRVPRGVARTPSPHRSADAVAVPPRPPLPTVRADPTGATAHAAAVGHSRNLDSAVAHASKEG